MTPRIEKTVFISYRRTNSFMARAVYQSLTSQGLDVFFDYEEINSGDFEQIILGNIRSRAHFIVILTPSALERCDEPGDWFRREIETGLREKRNIIPLFFEGFNFGSPSIAQHLTGDLTRLKNYNGLNVPPDYFNEAMEKLFNRFLNVPLDAVLHPLSSKAKKSADAQKAAAKKATRVTSEELSAEGWLEEGKKLVETKNYDEAIRCYTEAIRIKKDYAHAFNNRGYAREKKDDLEGALDDYNAAIRLKPDEAWFYYDRGNVRRKYGSFSGSIEDFSEAVRLKPNRAHVFYAGRARARREQEDLAGAIEDLGEAIRLKPDGSDYWVRGNARRDRGDLPGAIQDYEEAIRLKPDDAFFYYSRGRVLVMREDIAGAIKDFTEAIRLDPKFDRAYAARGDLWWAKEKHKSALADYEQAKILGGVRQEIADRINILKRKIK